MRRGESEDKLLCCLNLGTIERSQRRALGDLLPKKKLPVTYRSECLMGPRASLDVEERKNVSAPARKPCSRLVFLLTEPFRFIKSQVAMKKCIENKILAEIILQGKEKR
jgi:hypothetical protein